MTVMVRAAGLRGLPELVREFGGDPAALLGRFGVDARTLDSEDELVVARAAGELLETAAAELHCPDLGLRLAARQDTEVLGLLAAVIRNSLTFGDAVDGIIRYLSMHSPSLGVAQRPAVDQRHQIELRFDCLIGPLLPQVAGLGMGLLHRVLTAAAGGDYGLITVHLAHRPPAPLTAYTEFFGAVTLGSQRVSALRIPQESLGLPVAGADPAARAALREYLRTHHTFEPVLEQRVLRLLGESIGAAGPADLPAIAHQLYTHPRTVERRLSEAGTTFGALRDEVRRDAAYHLITAGAAPLGQVAALIGLTDQSSLTRAVRRWYGVSPLELRRSRRSNPTARMAGTGHSPGGPQ